MKCAGFEFNSETWFAGANMAFSPRRQGWTLTPCFPVAGPGEAPGGSAPLVGRAPRTHCEAPHGHVRGGRALCRPCGPGGAAGRCGLSSDVCGSRALLWKQLEAPRAGGGEVPGAQLGCLARTAPVSSGECGLECPRWGSRAGGAAVTSLGGLPWLLSLAPPRGSASGQAAGTPGPGLGQKPAHLPRPWP